MANKIKSAYLLGRRETPAYCRSVVKFEAPGLKRSRVIFHWIYVYSYINVQFSKQYEIVLLQTHSLSSYRVIYCVVLTVAKTL